MAYYAALASLMELLEDVLHHNRYPNFLLARTQTIQSLHNKFTRLLDSLQDYSSKGEEASDCVERKIRDVAHQAQSIIESEIPKQIRDAAHQAQDIPESEIPKQIRDAALQALDIIESEIPKQQTDSESGGNHVFRKKVFHLLVLACQNLLCPQPRLADCEEDLRKVGREVDSILKKVDEIKESQARRTLQLDYAADIGASDETSIGRSTMVGFEKYQKVIKEQLCGGSSQLQVISLVGMGGIGKTTLARNIFDDACIVDTFHSRVWVTISQDYDIIRVLESIIKCLGIIVSGGGEDALEEHEGEGEKLEEREREGDELEEREGEGDELEKREGKDDEAVKEGEGKNDTSKEIEAIKRRYKEEEKRKKKMQEKQEKLRKQKERELKLHIHQYLMGRSYLVIIDDVWSTKVRDDMNSIFHGDCNSGNKSRILLTTRSVEVGTYSGTELLHELQILNGDESWNLLKKTVFQSEDCPQELEHTGRFIARKCQGLPLAIVLIGGILSDNRAPRYWNTVADDARFFPKEDYEYLSKVLLSWSYNHLPHRLKPCFLYMGGFPEDYEISISKLIRLWIAEGFLNSANGTKSLEKIGEEYLEDLVKRSLVIITKKRANVHFKSCVIHDLLREFCREKGLCEHFFQTTDQKGDSDQCGAEEVRRIILGTVPPHMPWTYDNVKHVRSVCWFSKMAVSNVHSLEWGTLEQLRILDATDIETFVAPFAVSRMFHLKYLAWRISSKKKKHLPQSISRFQHLQTLILYAPRCVSISLPSEIWKLPQLRHIIIDRMILPPISMAGDTHLQILEYLQTLETVEDFIFTKEATQMMPNIKTLKLSCQGEEASGMWKLYSLDNLASLLQLEKLNIIFHATQFSYVDSFRSSFVFPKNLKKLSLEGCGLPWEELTVVGSLKYLQVLRLKKNALVGDEWEPVEEEFPELKFLLMDSLDLKHWTAEKTCFGRLEHLKINKCSDLKKIPSEIGDIDTLKFITVYDSKLAGVSAKKILDEQRDNANDELQVIVREYRIEHFKDTSTEMSKHSEDEGTA